MLAVDPSSKRSGGALLGDRARIEHDPRDDGVLIRSTAAGNRLGGLAAATREAVDALAPAFDVVVIETVGVGQSETDVEDVCDTIAVVVQPGSGDVLQFLKAGIMEVPDVLVVTKADLGDAAAALAARSGCGPDRAWARREVPVLAVSSVPPPQRDRGARRRRWTPTSEALDLPERAAACPPRRRRCASSPPSTATAACVRSAARRARGTGPGRASRPGRA